MLPAMKKSIRFDDPFFSNPRKASPWLGLLLVLALTGCGRLGLDGGDADKKSDSGHAAADPDGDRVALVMDGREISVAEVDAYLQNAFLEQLLSQSQTEVFEARNKGIQEMIQKRAIEAAAAERGVTPEELFDEIASQATPPTQEDIQAWYTENASRLRGAQLEDVSTHIEELLLNERRGQAWRDFMGPRLDALEFEIVLEAPRQELEVTRLVRGPADAPVTIMTFSDYQCPYCIRSEPVLAEVLARYPEQVRLVHRHFPLDSIHPFARPAAEAAMCAEEQDKFWEFHDAIFARAGQLSEDSFAEIGSELGLDRDALNECMEERRYAEFVQNDFDAGRAAGVTGTPAFFVNGVSMRGSRSVEDFSRVIDSELERTNVN
jgi:protein-disulfide isomerase